MILDVLAYKNKKLRCFSNPFYSQEKLENLEVSVTRQIIQGDKDKAKNLALYHFGTFDDITGKYDLKKEPELLFDCDDIIAALPGADGK